MHLHESLLQIRKHCIGKARNAENRFLWHCNGENTDVLVVSCFRNGETSVEIVCVWVFPPQVALTKRWRKFAKSSTKNGEVPLRRSLAGWASRVAHVREFWRRIWRYGGSHPGFFFLGLLPASRSIDTFWPIRTWMCSPVFDTHLLWQPIISLWFRKLTRSYDCVVSRMSLKFRNNRCLRPDSKKITSMFASSSDRNDLAGLSLLWTHAVGILERALWSSKLCALFALPILFILSLEHPSINTIIPHYCRITLCDSFSY